MGSFDRTHAVVLAGGSGARFWPLSREMSPKQLLGIFGTESLIAQAVHRVLPVVQGEPGRVTVVTNERLADELRNNLRSSADPALHRVDFLLEPVGRNTAPAIALAAASIVSDEPDAVLVVLPSDHVLAEGPEWLATMEAASALAEDGFIVTVGLKPTRAETGYGYIHAGDPMPERAVGPAVPRGVIEFVEKPDAEAAERFVASDDHFWNGGIFVARAADLLSEMRSLSADGARIADTAEWIALLPDDQASGAEARARFEALPALPIDVVVAERSSHLAVVPADLSWNDVGSFIALEALATPDADRNVRIGRGVDIDSHGTLVYSANRLVATLGMSDTVVIDTPDSTLVCPKDRCQDIRKVVEALKAMGAEEVVHPRTSLRPWGSWTTLLEEHGFRIKTIEVKPGSRLSLQRHNHRSEHWIVVSGTARVTRGAETFELHVNESTHIPIGEAHRLENCGLLPLKLIEVQVGEYVGEDDIIRIEDDYER